MGGACTVFEIPLLSSLLYLLGWAERAPLGAQTPWDGGRSSAKRRDRCGLTDPAGERGGSRAESGTRSDRVDARAIPCVIRFEDTARRGV